MASTQSNQPQPLEFQKKGGAPVFLRRSVANAVIGLYNAFIGLEVLQPQTDGLSIQNTKAADIKKTDQKITITLQPQLNPQSFQGSGGGSGLNFQFPRELDPTVPVPAMTLIYISPANPLATAGLTDLVTDQLIHAMPGIWLSLQSVPAEVTVSGTVKYNMPQVLASGTVSGTPLKGDADNAEIFWIPIAGIMNCG